MSNEGLVIDDKNFDQYFFDIKKHRPQKGQVLARYAAVAELTDKFPKGALVDMLVHNPKAPELVPKVLRNMCHVLEKDATRLALEMANDLVAGMTESEVISKSYRMQIELFFWAKPEYVPRDDPHWSCVEIINSLEENDGGEVNNKG
jgi:hypothetical protein